MTLRRDTLSAMNCSSLFRRCRRGLVALALLCAISGRVCAAPLATIVGLKAARVADLVLVNAGHDAGLRQGMVCEVARGGRQVAQILLVELRRDFCAALIVNVGSQGAIRAGDTVQAKVLKS